MDGTISEQLHETLSELHRIYPQWRYGQLIINVTSWAGVERPMDPWDATDQQLLEAARNHLAKARSALRKTA